MQVLNGLPGWSTTDGVGDWRRGLPDPRGPLVAVVVAAMTVAVAVVVPLDRGIDRARPEQPASAASGAAAAVSAASAGTDLVRNGQTPEGLTADEWTGIQHEIADARAVDAVPGTVAAGQPVRPTAPDAIAGAPRLATAELVARFAGGSAAVSSGSAVGSDLVLTTSRLGDVATAAPSAVAVAGGVEFGHAAGVTEWFRTTPEGLQQGFTIESPVSDRGAFDIVVGVEGGQPSLLDSQAVSISRPGHADLLYRDLLAWDANDARLPAWMSVDGTNIVLTVEATGAAYPITVDPTIEQAQQVLPSVEASATSARFGESVALDDASGDMILVVGAVGDATALGADGVSVYRDSGSGFVLESVLHPPVLDDSIQFGWDVDVRGEVVVVGAPGDDTNGTDAGAVYVFEPAGAGGPWQQTGTVYQCDPAITSPCGSTTGVGSGFGAAQFGFAVDLSDQFLVVGAPGHGSDTGAAALFVRNGSDWETTAAHQLGGAGLVPGDQYGYAVSAADAGTHILVGSPGNDNGANLDVGAAYYQQWDGVALSAARAIGFYSIVDGDAGAAVSVDVAPDGDAVMHVGAPVNTRFEDGTEPGDGHLWLWVLPAGADPVTGTLGSYGSAAFADGQGRSIDFTGDDVVFGTYLHDAGATDAGGGYRFPFVGNSYGTGSPLTVPANAGDMWGFDVAAQGDVYVLSGPGNDTSGADSGQISVRSFTNSFAEYQIDPQGDRFGFAVDIDGNRMAVSAIDMDGPGINVGVVFMFSRPDATSDWVADGEIVSPDPEAGGRFGDAVAVLGDRVAIGESDRFGDQGENGRVFVFERTGPAAWSQVGTEIAAQLGSYDAFGASVAWQDTNTLVVGAPAEGSSTGAVYQVSWDGMADWEAPVAISTLSAAVGDELGYSVAADQDRFANWIIAAGAPGDDGGIDATADSGALHIYRDAGAPGSASHEQVVQVGTGWDAGDRMGTAVASDNGYLAVAGIGDGANGADYQAYALEDFGSGYSIFGTFNGTLPVTVNDTPNNYVALLGRNLFLGRPGSGGEVGIFRDTDGNGFPATPTDTFLPPELVNGDALGFSVAVDERSMAAGAPGDQADAGAVYTNRSLSLSHRFIAASGDWTDPTSWDTGIVPGTNDTVVVSSGSLSVDGSQSAGRLIVQTGATVVVPSGGGTLTLTGGPTGTWQSVIEAGATLRNEAPTTLNIVTTDLVVDGLLDNRSGEVLSFQGTAAQTVSGTGTFANAGIIRIENPTSVTIDPTLTYTSAATSRIEANVGSLAFDLPVTENGTVAVAAGANVQYGDEFTGTAGTVLEISIDGPFDNGTIYFGTTLGPDFGGATLRTVGSYSPLAGESFTVIGCYDCGTPNLVYDIGGLEASVTGPISDQAVILSVPLAPGTISATQQSAPASVNLTTEGTTDWVTWSCTGTVGCDTPPFLPDDANPYARKDGPPVIGTVVVDPTQTNTTNAPTARLRTLGDALMTATWTDGDPSVVWAGDGGVHTSGSAHTGYLQWCPDNCNSSTTDGALGTSVTFPVTAPTTGAYDLRLYVSNFQAIGELTVTLPGASPVVLTQDAGGGTSATVFDVRFQAGAPGDVLTATWEQTGSYGVWSNLQIMAATLEPVAGPLTVDTIDDTVVVDGLCSLREAVIAANGDSVGGDCGTASGADLIDFAVSGTITLGSRLPIITSDITIDGSAQDVTISGGGTSAGIMRIDNGVVNLANLSIINSRSQNCPTSPTIAGGDNCGAVLSYATLNVTNVTFSGNVANSGTGSAIANREGTLTIDSSTFTSNNATYSSAIWNRGDATIINSTLVDNGNGAIYNYNAPASLVIINSTIVETAGGAWAIRNNNSLTLQSSIVASAAAQACFGIGTVTADGFNLASDNTCGGATTSTLAALGLGPLADNGGPTQTRALSLGSSALDAADPLACPALDQRGEVRPQGSGCDSGAYESNIVVAPPAPVGLLGHWNFDEASSGLGTGVLVDVTGGGNDGAIRGGAQYIPGVVGEGALRFDGANDYVDFGLVPALDLVGGDYTISFWTDYDSNNGRGRIINMDENANVSGGYSVFTNELDAPSLCCRSTHNSGAASDTGGNYTTLTPSEWNHVALVYDSAAGERTFFYDGVAQTPFSTPAPLTSDGDDPLLFGAYQAASRATVVSPPTVDVASATIGPEECRPGYTVPQCSAVPYDTTANLAAPANGWALPAVAKDTIGGNANIHQAEFVNDGYYGNGSSWIGTTANSWIKIDLGCVTPVDGIRFGRDRRGGYDDRDPGRIQFLLAITDDVYANANDGNDTSEYSLAFDSSVGVTVSGTQTLRASFAPRPARYVKVLVQNSGAAIDELEVSGVSCGLETAPAGMGQFFKGSLDEVKLFDLALTPAEVQALAAVGIEVPANKILAPFDSNEFASAVDVDGDTAVVAEIGLPGEVSALYVLERNPLSGVWSITQTESFSGPPFSNGVVDIAVHGNVMAAVADTGEVGIWERSGPGNPFAASPLTAGLSGMRSVDTDGTGVFAAGPQGGSLWTKDVGGTWQPANSTGEASVDHGADVAIDGSVIVVSVNDAVAVTDGVVYVYDRAGSMWTGPTDTLSAPAGSTTDGYFGSSVDVHGSTLVIGQDLEDNDAGDPRGVQGDAGAAWVYSGSPGAWGPPVKLVPGDNDTANRFGSSVAIDGASIVVGAAGAEELGVPTRNGAAYLYQQTPGGLWVEADTLRADDGQDESLFGADVGVSGNNVIVGAPFDDNANGVDAGAAYVYDILIPDNPTLSFSLAVGAGQTPPTIANDAGIPISQISGATPLIESKSTSSGGVGSTALDATGVSESALRGTLLGETPFGAIAVSNEELAGLPILSIGLDLPNEDDWPQILATTEFADRPIVNVTVGEVFEAADLDQQLKAKVDAIPFGAIDVGGTPFGAIPFGAIALGGVPLTLIPPGPDVPDVEAAWCDILDGTSKQCVAGSLDPDETLMSISLSDVPFGAIPFREIPFGAIPVEQAPFGAIELNSVQLEDTPFGAIPFGAIEFGATDINASPFGAIPFGAISPEEIPFGAIDIETVGVDGIPFGAILLEDLPFGAIPFGAIEVNGAPFGAIPYGAIALAEVNLVDIPLDPERTTTAEIEADWCALMAEFGLDCTNGATTVNSTTITELGIRGLPFGAIPFGAIYLDDLPFGAISPEQIPFGAIALADVPFGAINLNAVDIDQISLEGTPFGAIPFGAISPTIGAIPFGAIDVQGSPFGAILLEDLPFGAIGTEPIPFGAIPFGAIGPEGTPFGAIPYGAIPFGAIGPGGTVGEIPFGAIDLVDSPFGAIPFDALPFGAIGTIVDCDLVDCDSNASLRDAFLAGAILPGATLGDLGDAAANLRLPDLAEHLLGIPAQELYDAVFQWGDGKVLTDLTAFANMTLGDLPVDHALFRQTVLSNIKAGLSTVSFEELALALLLTSVADPAGELETVVDGFGAALTLADFDTFGDTTFSELLPAFGGSALGELGAFLAFVHLGDLGFTPQQITAALETNGTGTGGVWLVSDAINAPELGLGDMKLADIVGSPEWGAATVLDLVNSLPPDEVAGFTFSDLLLGMLPPGALPWGLAFEKIDAESIPGVMPPITLQSDFSLTGTRSRSVEVSVELPTNAAYLPGSTQVTPAVGGDLEPNEVDGRLVWTFSGVTPGPDSVTPGQSYTMTFDVQPTLSIGSTAVNADSRVVGAPGSVSSTTLLQVLEAFEPNDVLAEAEPVAEDVVYLTHISDENDIDLFSVEVLENDRLAVDLSGLPADFDVVLYRETTAPGGTEALSRSILAEPLVPVLDPDADSSETVPDQSFPRLDLTEPSLSMVAISNSRGLAKESIVTDRLKAGRYVIQVHGHDGASSPEPSVLQINVIEAGIVPVCVARGAFATSPTPGAALNIANLPADLDTVILINEMRFEQIYGSTGRTEVATALADLVAAMGNDPEISTLGLSAAVVAVDGSQAVRDAYAFWDDPAAYAGSTEDACNPETANDVVSTIIEEILDPIRDTRDVENIVLVGSDDLLPFGRLADATEVANEFDYRNDLSGRNAFTGSFWASTFLSDDPYAETGALPFGDRFLYVPDAALGRVLETPEQIVAQVQQFIAFDGFLAADSGLIAGYDFLVDGSEAIADELQQNGAVPLVDDVLADGFNAAGEAWTAADIEAALLDVPAGENGFDLVSFNAHFDHYRALPAAGDKVPNFNDNFESSVITGLTLNDQRLDGTIIFSMGCHSGLNVPNTTTNNNVGVTGAAEDWAEVFTEQRAVYIGNTGFGYGDTETVGYTERLMQLFARNVASPVADDIFDASTVTTIGDAMRYAKQEVFSELNDVSVYHEKAYQESTFYGLPFFRVGVAPVLKQAPPDNRPEVEELTGTPAATYVAEPQNSPNVVETVDEGGFVVKTETFYSNLNGAGDPVTITQPGRPIQPGISIDVTDVDPADPTRLERQALGAIILDMTSTYIEVDPVLSVPVFDQSSQAPEPDRDDIVYPTVPGRITTFERPEGARQNLVLATGQYRGTETTGVQRLDDDLDVVVYYADPTVTDRTAPRILRVDTSLDGAELSVTAQVEDATGVDRVYVLVTATPNQPQAEWVGIDLTDLGGGQWAGGYTFASAPVEIELLAQAKDEPGNIGVSTNKARNFGDESVPPPPVTTLTTTLADPGGSIVNGYYTGPVTVTADAGGTPIQYRLNNSGAPLDLDLVEGVVVSGDRRHSIEIIAIDGQRTTRTFKIDSLPPTATISKPVVGASYLVGQTVKSSFQCLDASGATCTGVVTKDGATVATPVSGQNLPTAIPGTYQLTVTATDPVGRSVQAVRTYTVSAPPALLAISVPSTPQLITNGADVDVQFTDADGTDETYTVKIDYGDADPDDSLSTSTTCTVSTEAPVVAGGGTGVPSCALTQSPDQETGAVGTVTSQFVYPRNGVFVITVTVEDSAGNPVEVRSDDFVVVYDPGAGRVSGSGKFWSADSSYVDADTEGEWAHFGYKARYKSQDSIPDGDTKLKLKGNFKFTSTSYDYLIINDTMAVAEGLGEIDEVGGFRFRVQGIDNGSTDFFQITIWEDADPENVIYDNGVIFDENGNSDGDEVLTGGIKIKP